MIDALRPIAAETLLRERGWVEALARSLVLDDATADDVVQQTWLAALESPPREAGSLRGWLSRVVRNAASESRRRAARRERWEAAAPARGPETSPAETVAKADAHRRVVDAVMSLDEPYRTAVLLRFFEDLPSDEVARRTGVPVETARTRIKRALALLRGRLDRELGGDGSSWAFALLPLAGARKGIVAASGATGTAAGTATGGMVMATTKTLAAGALVGALLGSLVTAGVMARTDVPVAAAPAPAPSKSEVASPPPQRDSARAVEPTTPPAAPQVTAPRSALAAAFDEVEIEPPRFVAGAITGVVRTKDGAGVAGVIVRGTTQPVGRPTRRPSGQAAATSAEESVRDAIGYAKWYEATNREAQTDASGAFTLTRLTEGTYSLGASAKGWSIRAEQGSDARSVKAGAAVDFVATALVDVPVTVLLPGGAAPTEQVLVRWSLPRGGGGGGSAWWKPDSPVLGVEPGTWEMHAESGKEARSSTVSVTATLGNVLPPVTLQLESVGSIEGVVRFDPPESAWASAEVSAVLKGTTVRRSVRPVTVKPPGWKFAFDGLEPGEYELAASWSRGSRSPPDATAVVQVNAGRVVQDLVIPRTSPSEWLVVRVTGPDGKLLDDRDVSFGLKEEMVAGAGGYGASSVRRADGTFLVSLRVRTGDKDIDFSDATHFGSDWRLEVRSRAFGVRMVEFVRGKTERVDVKFGEVARFRPVIAGAEGTPLAGRLTVLLAHPGQSDSAAFNNNLGDAVEPGRYVAILRIGTGGGFYARVLARVPVDLRAGDNEVTIPVPELSTLTLRIPGAGKGSEVSIKPARLPSDSGFAPTLTTEDGGIVSCPDLIAGNYCATVTLDGEVREMIVRVPASGEMTFAPTQLAGLAVTVDDESGLLAKSGFRTGDLIVAIDRVAIDSMRRLQLVLYASRGHESADVEVRRGGRTEMLSVDPSKISLRADFGGSWEPVLR